MSKHKILLKFALKKDKNVSTLCLNKNVPLLFFE